MPTSKAHANSHSIVRRSILSEISAALGTPSSRLGLVSSFIQNGGDSLSAVQLQIALRKHGIQISIHDIFTATSLLCLTEQVGVESVYDLDDVPSQSPIPRRERKYSDTNLPPPKRLHKASPRIAASGDKDMGMRYPMTEMQISLVQSTQINAGYNVISYLETYRPEHIPALKFAWESVLRLEEIFNISFRMDEPDAYLCERRQAPFVWEEVTVQDESSYQQELKTKVVLDEHVQTKFKVVTLRPPGTEGKSTVIWRVHHAMIDGVSCSIVLSKVRQVLAGKPIQAGPSFGDVSLKLQALQLQGHESAIEFWTKQKKNHPSPSSQLLLAAPPDDQGISRPEEIGREYISSDIGALKEIAKAAEVTPASLYYAAWGLVLSRYTESSSVLLGAILSGRNLPIEGVGSVVGPLLNVLPLYVSLRPPSTIREYLQSVFAALLELTSFHWTTPSHGFMRDFHTAVSVRFDVPELASAPFPLLEPPCSRVCSDVPLSIEVGHCGRICLSYHTKSFSRSSIEQLAVTFKTAFDSILNLDSTVAACLDSLVSNDQRANLARIGNWSANPTRHGVVKDDLVSLFTQAVERNPSQRAVEHRTTSTTYAQLHEKSSLVARSLSKLVSPGDIVCVHADGSINWIIAIYAILKTGAVYCPLAPSLPKAAREANFIATNAKLYLTADAMTKSSRPASCEVCLSVEELLLVKSSLAGDTPRPPRPTANAYLCFTSGTTGKPKGVLCRHESLVAFQSGFQVRLCAGPGWRIAQFMSPEFDGSIHEIFSALSYGATLVLKDDSRPFDHLKRCDAAILTPTVAKALDPAEFQNLQKVYFVGEAVRQNVCDLWARQRELFNMYGPTEATCGATIKRLAVNKPVTLGVPNPSTRVYILDSQRRVVPLGVIGEIYLAGIQVATGYIGQATDTAMRFLPDSVNPQYTGEYMYKTGDRAYWNEDGELTFLGRRDRQVKLRGFRIDLDDLEARMAKAYDKCSAVAVAVKDDHLVALVQPAHLDLYEFRLHIRNHIPAYALPSHIISVRSFPTTPVGKLDYKAIIAAVASASSAQEVPLTVSREMITSILRTVLGICPDEHIDLDFTFADLGVNSLLALHLSQRLSRSFKLRIPVSMVLGTATVRSLVEAVSCLQAPEIQAGSILGDHRISPIEAEWWHKYQHANTSSFNVTYACELPATLERPKFVKAWNMLLCRHRILRCRYASSDLHGLRREYAPLPPIVESVEAIDIQREINIPFDLERDELVRVLISPTQLLVVISHIICDLTTLRILLHEVAETYQGKEPAQIAKTYSQTAWSIPASPAHLSFWSNHLLGAPVPQFSVGRIGTRRKRWTGSSYIYRIPKSTHQAMNRFAAKEKVTMHQLILASVALALQHENNYCDITIGAPYLNRHSEEDLEVVGLFLEPLPIRIRGEPTGRRAVAGNNTAATTPCARERNSFIKTVQQASESALSHAVAWDQLLSHLNLTPDFPNHPLFDVMVTFHEASQEVELPLPGVRFVPTWSEGAKFKLMAEFTARWDGDLSLRLEYSDECFTVEDVRVVARLVFEALDGLVAGDEYVTIARKLRHISGC